jgi:LCP family protein required for cell wall assembly
MSLVEGEARGRHATTYGQGFGGVVLWTILGSFLPGSGLVVAGRRALGVAILAINVVLLAGVVVAVKVAGLAGILDFAASPSRIVVAATVLLALVLLWALVVLGTHASLRRYAHLTLPQRVLSSGLVVAIVALVLIPAARAADYSLIYKDAANSIFSSDNTSGTTTNSRPNTTKADPWANIPRVNVLLLGSDAGSDRTGIRTDTVILASIDTKSGRTVLFSLPRNLQGVPFPAGSAQAAAYPSGYSCPDQSCMLNALWQFGVEHKAQYYPQAKSDFDAGYTAIKDGVEQTLGLSVDTYAIVDMKGLVDFVDAIGGVTVPVTEKLAIGGAHDGNGNVTQFPKAYLKPGVQHLNGYYAMWYARSRFNTDDYSRMTRQRCLLGYVSDQTDPMAVLKAFPGIAKAAKSNIRTGIQIDGLGAWAELALRVKKGGISSLAFTNKVLGSTADPDFAFIQERVQKAVTAKPRPIATTTPSPNPSATRTGGTPSPSPTSTVPDDEAASLKDVCAPVP